KILEAVSDLAGRVMAEEQVRVKLGTMMSASSHKVLEDDTVLLRSKVFVAEVMGDDAVQRSGGDALWNTVQYALQTRLIKVIGFGLLCGSVIVLGGR
ncbi:unnamed protein product, partial [Discosporangium mesarthrocarpum]